MARAFSVVGIRITSEQWAHLLCQSLSNAGIPVNDRKEQNEKFLLDEMY